MSSSAWRSRGRGRGSASSSSSDPYRGHHHHGGGHGIRNTYRGGHGSSSSRDEDAQPNLDEGRNLRSANYFIGRREPEPAPPLVSSSHPLWPARGEPATTATRAVPSLNANSSAAPSTSIAAAAAYSGAGGQHAQQGANGGGATTGTDGERGRRAVLFAKAGRGKHAVMQCTAMSMVAERQSC